VTTQDALFALAGGACIGLAATGLLLFNGRVAGISGILGGLLGRDPAGQSWRLGFLGGLVVAGVVLAIPWPDAFSYTVPRSMPLLGVGGLLVGFGTRLGSGCTSGHGVCGLSRLSGRALAATLAFMGAGIATVFVLGLVGATP